MRFDKEGTPTLIIRRKKEEGYESYFTIDMERDVALIIAQVTLSKNLYTDHITH